MNSAAHDLQIRIDAILRHIQIGREAVAIGQDVDLSALSDEVQDISEIIRKSPLRIDRQVAVKQLETIIINLNSLQQELTARHSTVGGDITPDVGPDD